MPFPVSGVKKWTGGRTHLLPATITTQRTGHHDQEDEASRPTKRAAATGDERPIHYLRAGGGGGSQETPTGRWPSARAQECAFPCYALPGRLQRASHALSPSSAVTSWTVSLRPAVTARPLAISAISVSSAVNCGPLLLRDGHCTSCSTRTQELAFHVELRDPSAVVLSAQVGPLQASSGERVMVELTVNRNSHAVDLIPFRHTDPSEDAPLFFRRTIRGGRCVA